ncbi:MAG: outer rane cobalamin receptor protein [Proteobacteria bacterium]|nr:outer rane cobalamin receptor protein [Pseudomonadota bacterium]
MNPRRSFTLSTLALFAAFPALAADPQADAVLVTATRFREPDSDVAANVSVITRQDIRNTPAQNLPDVLSTRAGVDVRQLGGAMGRNATVDMRGFGETATSNTLILVDGLRVNPVDMGSIIWSSIPLESVERIEIMRGSGTVLYGDGATGGVINIITNKSGNQVAALTATVGSYGYKGTDIQLANGNDQAYYNLFVNYADADGYRQNSQQDQRTASGRVGWLLDRGEVFTDFAVYKESNGLPGSVFSAAYRDDPRSTRTPSDTESRDGYRIRPGVSYRLNEDATLEGEVAHERQNLDAKYVASGMASDRVRQTTSFTPRLRWRHGLEALPSETVVGYDYYDGKVNSDNTGYASQGASQQSSSLYLQNVTKFSDELSLTVGGRSQRMKQQASQDAYGAGWSFSPAMDGDSARTRNAYDVGLAYAAGGWRVYGKSGTTFRFANLDELFGYDPITYTPVFAGDLKPQHGTSNEVGGSVAVGPAKLRAALYRIELTDEIGFDGSSNTNLDPTRRQGGELEADWKISDDWQAKASYAYVDATFRSGTYSGNEVPLVARNQASAQLTWNTGRTGSYSAVARYVGERRYGSDYANTQGMLAGYTTLDLQSVWNLKPWKITAKLINAFDKKYSPYAAYSAYRNDTYYYPADGRSVFVSARYDF